MTKIEINNSRKIGKVIHPFSLFSENFFFLSLPVHAQDAIALDVHAMAVRQTPENAILNKVLRTFGIGNMKR